MNTNIDMITIPVRLDAATFRGFAIFDTLKRQKRWKSPAIFAAILMASAIVCFAMNSKADQAVLLGGQGELTNFLDRCPNVPDFKQHASKARNISLTAQETLQLREMGFSLFKLQGRLDIPYVFFFDFLRYALENQLAFPAAYPIFCFSVRNHLKEKERRRRAQAQGKG